MIAKAMGTGVMRMVREWISVSRHVTVGGAQQFSGLRWHVSTPVGRRRHLRSPDGVIETNRKKGS